MSKCIYDESLEPYYCEADWNCKDCPNWVDEPIGNTDKLEKEQTE